MKIESFKKYFPISIAFFLVAFPVLAIDYNSTSYTVKDPVVMTSGYASSAGFKLWSSFSQPAIGTSTATGFILNSGFLFFPYISTPVISATAGDAQVVLSWTSAAGVLGWTATSYSIGQSTVSGGPYTYTAVGELTSVTRTGLTNGTKYYFIVRVGDATGSYVATSTETYATPVATPVTPVTPPGGGGISGGGGGGGGAIIQNVILSGRAYPMSAIVLLKDGQMAASTIAGPDARFEVSLSGLASGEYVFAVYGKDKDGNKSTMFTFPSFISSIATTRITGIFIAPTIAVDKSEVKRGDNIAIFGQSSPQSEIVIQVNSNQEFFAKTPADKNGVYLLNFDTSVLENGNHSTKSKATLANEISSFSSSVGFLVGTKNVALLQKKGFLKGDLNDDGKVNLVDFSIAAYWYKRTLSATFKPIEVERLNGDGKIDLVDFSIMAYYWTG